jgi:hypothetical protein
MKKQIIFSCYFDNIAPDMRKAHEKVCRTLYPNAKYLAIRTESHGHTLDDFTAWLKRNEYDQVMILDIDAIPVSRNAFDINPDGITACIQYPNHIPNASWYYAPFAFVAPKAIMDTIKASWKEVPNKYDVGGAVTHELELKRYPVELLYPTHVEEAPAGGMWQIKQGVFKMGEFGLGTTYSTQHGNRDVFYHAFQARDPRTLTRFVNKVHAVLEAHK